MVSIYLTQRLEVQKLTQLFEYPVAIHAEHAREAGFWGLVFEVLHVSLAWDRALKLCG